MGLKKKCLDEKKGQEWEQYNIHSLNQKLSESRDEEMTKYTQRMRTGGSSQRHSVRFLKKNGSSFSGLNLWYSMVSSISSLFNF